MKKPKISVIMAVHNSEKFLRSSVESILNQTLKDLELIIINDGSSDNSSKIIKEYTEKDKRIISINNLKNLGPAGTRNQGLKIAKGKYIAILDSDDISSRERLKIQYNYLEKHPNIFLVGSSAIFIDESGKIVSKFRKYDDYEVLAWRFPKSCGIIHSSVMYRNEKIFFYNEKFRYAHDYELYLHLLNSGKNLTNLPQFLVKYRVHADSISVSKHKEQVRFANLTRERHKNLRNRISFLNRSIFSVKLILFYIRTFMEKRIKN